MIDFNNVKQGDLIVTNYREGPNFIFQLQDLINVNESGAKVTAIPGTAKRILPFEDVDKVFLTPVDHVNPTGLINVRYQDFHIPNKGFVYVKARQAAAKWLHNVYVKYLEGTSV